MQPRPVPVFDGHNDTLLKLELGAGTPRERSFFERSSREHIDLPRAREGGFAGGLFAMYVPSRACDDTATPYRPDDPANYAEVAHGPALDFTLKLAARALRLARDSDGQVAICRDATEIRAAIASDVLAMVLHIEGAEAIDAELTSLEVLHSAGLRSLGPVWSRSNIFGHGVPMTCPASPDTGPGLTEAGCDLVRACNRLGIMIDLSHITEKGFWDVAGLSDRPLVASHSNAHAICPSSRNLTDRQLDAVAESGGLVGLNFHVAFLRPDGAHRSDTPLELMVRHVDHLLERLGEDGVALGSDFDGCMVPGAIGDAAGLPKLIDAFRKAGYGEDLIEKIAWRNWVSVLERTWA
ncbi:membrane dipeptidase [Stappia taiwanensis]|uniref:Membrane dipeptidase n=1 Tax=Stappia taiwanensis TaxID=992267 RepID=A0A838XVC4_9HYPH|nr:dipeptidase [Stappia taiwanensis]MBA4612568.1 membrane dipeptidase [Stappia taiwanensis]GGE89449.1 membrane dipeptidase [Stappia taiwanensis]